MKLSSQSGAVNPLLITSIILGLLTATLAGAAFWSFTNYQDQKNNVDKKVADAVAKAKTVQSEEDEKKFLEREKLPTRTFQGPVDLGGVTFQYPKTWSVYVAKTGASLEAYLQPDSVPTVSSSQPYAARVIVEDKSYDTVVKSYDDQVKKGELRSSQAVVEGFTGVRLDGKFSKTREGSAVIFKVRDKALTVATDSTSFAADFNDTILKSLKFNP